MEGGEGAHHDHMVVVEAGAVGGGVVDGLGRVAARVGGCGAVCPRGLQVNHEGAADVFTQDLVECDSRVLGDRGGRKQ